MGKFLFVRIGFGDEFIRDKKFEVITVGENNGLGEADGFVATSPVESGLENNFIRRLALGLIKTRSSFGLAENVGDAVIADAVAAAKIGVRVVVEGAPADAAGILRIEASWS